jgi:phosphotransferase system  glucose/maltose/N-acetylglucosamine-specific IIC component
VKEFVVYTGLRILLFVASLITVMLVWSLLNGAREVPVLWAVVIAFAISGVLSYFLLNRQRDAFARRVEERASRASAAFEERKAREDGH